MTRSEAWLGKMVQKLDQLNQLNKDMPVIRQNTNLKLYVYDGKVMIICFNLEILGLLQCTWKAIYFSLAICPFLKFYFYGLNN